MILLSHFLDLDGISPIVLCEYFKKNIPVNHYYMMDYSNDMEDQIIKMLTPHMNEELIITDLRINKQLYKFYTQFSDYNLFDHHLESLEFKNEDKVYVDDKYSATYLFYDWLKIIAYTYPSIDYYVNLVDTYDMWKTDSPFWEEAVDLNMVLWGSQNYNMPERDWRRLNQFINIQLKKFEKKEWAWTPYEKDIISKGRAGLNRAINQAKNNMKIRKDDHGKMFALYFGASKISLVCNDLLKNYPQLDYILNINTYQNNAPEAINGKISARSREMNLTNFRGINGHTLAAGGTFSEEFLIKLWNGSISNIPYKKERVIGAIHSEKKHRYRFKKESNQKS